MNLIRASKGWERGLNARSVLRQVKATHTKALEVRKIKEAEERQKILEGLGNNVMPTLGVKK